MAWNWKIFLAAMVRPEGTILSSGYSGKGDAKNNPDAINQPFRGPIPVGLFFIGDPIEKHETMGEFVLPLTPDPRNVMFGRYDFYIHGDSIEHPGWASDGCIVTSRWAREAIASSDDRDLIVTP